ncbi:MAG TPA: hypothetical protein VG963_09260 [Polyangiaceae bacterium]|nr:hypothetical protein [Polyangiaceae bacterium]
MFRCPGFCALALPLPAACLAALVYSSPALACGATPCSELQDAQPNDADGPVPLNTELRVLYFGTLQGDAGGACDLALTHLRLVPRNGSAIDLEGTLFADPSAQHVWVTAKPAEQLLPNTSYTLQVEEGLTAGSCSCGEDVWVKATSFTTGLEPHVGAPEFSGLNRLRSGTPGQGFTGGCTETNVVPVTLELGMPETRSGLRYDIYVDGVLRQRYVSPSSPGQIETQCTTASGSGALLDGGSQVEVRAVDLAGNESAAHAPLKLTATCEEEAGCALSPGIRSKTPGVLWSLSLALLAVARCRAVRSAPRYAARRP